MWNVFVHSNHGDDGTWLIFIHLWPTLTTDLFSVIATRFGVGCRERCLFGLVSNEVHLGLRGKRRCGRRDHNLRHVFRFLYQNVNDRFLLVLDRLRDRRAGRNRLVRSFDENDPIMLLGRHGIERLGCRRVLGLGWRHMHVDVLVDDGRGSRRGSVDGRLRGLTVRVAGSPITRSRLAGNAIACTWDGWRRSVIVWNNSRREMLAVGSSEETGRRLGTTASENFQKYHQMHELKWKSFVLFQCLNARRDCWGVLRAMWLDLRVEAPFQPVFDKADEQTRPDKVNSNSNKP